MLLRDKVAVITGGAGRNGLGFATAKLMAVQGARVAILDLARAEPQAAAARLGAGHLGLVADVTDKASQPCAEVLGQAYRRIHRLVGQFPAICANQNVLEHLLLLRSAELSSGPQTGANKRGKNRLINCTTLTISCLDLDQHCAISLRVVPPLSRCVACALRHET